MLDTSCPCLSNDEKEHIEALVKIEGFQSDVSYRRQWQVIHGEGWH